MQQKTCLYCDNLTNAPHFQSACCGRGMCDECYDSLVEHDEQLHVLTSNVENLKEKYAHADYVCFDCPDGVEVFT